MPEEGVVWWGGGEACFVVSILVFVLGYGC